MKQDTTLKNKALQIFDFFKKKDLGDLFLYFDDDFNDYYIVVNDAICDTEKYYDAASEYMRKFDISNIHILSKKRMRNTSDLQLLEHFRENDAACDAEKHTVNKNMKKPDISNSSINDSIPSDDTDTELKNKALKIFDFFKKKDLGDLFLYFDDDFNDYYIVVNDAICDTEKYYDAASEYMRKFDISNIHVLSKKRMRNTSNLTPLDSVVSFRELKLLISKIDAKYTSVPSVNVSPRGFISEKGTKYTSKNVTDTKAKFKNTNKKLSGSPMAA